MWRVTKFNESVVEKLREHYRSLARCDRRVLETVWGVEFCRSLSSKCRVTSDASVLLKKRLSECAPDHRKNYGVYAGKKLDPLSARAVDVVSLSNIDIRDCGRICNNNTVECYY